MNRIVRYYLLFLSVSWLTFLFILNLVYVRWLPSFLVDYFLIIVPPLGSFLLLLPISLKATRWIISSYMLTSALIGGYAIISNWVYGRIIWFGITTIFLVAVIFNWFWTGVTLDFLLRITVLATLLISVTLFKNTISEEENKS